METTPNLEQKHGLLFSPGLIVETPGALAILHQYNLHPIRLIARHLSGDWGDVSSEDSAANQYALANGGQVRSCYVMAAGERLWVTTESDRCVTTIMLPSER
ncbi:MAG: hypothetical protein FHK80_16550 [Azoarcus sp. PHD]|nr:MAG: hypothetical protein FHK80_16550 [Azoarcus sp. PHD]